MAAYSLAKTIGDGVPAIATEASTRCLDTRRGLPPLVLGGVEHVLRAAHHVSRIAFSRNVPDAALLFDQSVQHRVKRRILGERVLILLIGPELGCRRLGDRVLRNDLPRRPE